jgi:hypothetical protein
METSGSPCPLDPTLSGKSHCHATVTGLGCNKQPDFQNLCAKTDERMPREKIFLARGIHCCPNFFLINLALF